MFSSRSDFLRNDQLISRVWNFRRSSGSLPGGAVLVTGASSFIGCHLVKKLMVRFPGMIRLLLRAPSADEARDKMKRAVMQWNIADLDTSSLVFYAGDTTLPAMGLNRDAYAVLKEETSHIIHLAMTPIHHMPYSHYQRVWIPDLERLIRLCGDTKSPKKLHYLSPATTHLFDEEDDTRRINSNVWQSGFAAFKWMAVAAVRNAIQQGLSCTLYELPMIIGPSGGGSSPRYYPVWQLMEVFLKSGGLLPFRLRILPVDLLADLIIYNVAGPPEVEDNMVLRPALTELVDEVMLQTVVPGLSGLQPAGRKVLREQYDNKLWFDFMIPENYAELMPRFNELLSVFPVGFNHDTLPAAALAFNNNFEAMRRDHLIRQENMNSNH